MASILIFIAIICLVLLMMLVIISNNRAEQRKRVQEVVQGKDASSKAGGQKGALTKDQRRAEITKKLKQSGAGVGKESKSNLPEKIMQAGLSISIRQFWIYSVLFAVASSLIVKLMGASWFVTAMFFVTALFGIPRLFLARKAKSRQKKFLKEFADALDAMTRLLKAGMPVSEAIKMVAREFTGPVAEEMGWIYDQQKIGISLPEAVLSCAKRIPLTEMKMFATAVSIQAQTGSSLSEVLENLSKVIRARFALKRKIDALSSEAKSSAMIIGALPVIVATGMYFINREYIEVLFIEPKGKLLLGAAIASMSVGIFVMKQMINFKV